MPRFFIAPPPTDTVTIAGEDARHIAKVLRMREGESIALCDGAGMDYAGEILAVSPSAVVVQVLEKKVTHSETSFRIRLYQALPKGEKLDWIVQKAVELGVCEIVPVLTERCVSRPNAKSMTKKCERLQKIALEAAKQAGRGMIPAIAPLQTFSEAIAEMKAYTNAILFYEHAQTPLSACLKGGMDTALMVGSEGGFTAQEACAAAGMGIAVASLGKRILRCETAPICALSAILFASGEF